MARIDLKKSAGLSLNYENGSITSDDFKFERKKDFHIKEISQQLLNEEVTSPDYFFTKYYNCDQDNIFKDKGLQINIVVLMPNLAGIEFVKTLTDLNKKSHRIIDVIYGGGILLQQDFDKLDLGVVYTSTMKKGSKALVHAGYDYVMTNTKSTPLIYLEVSLDGSDSINELDDMRGMSYYVIRKNAKQEVVRNPEYRQANNPKKLNFDKVLTKMGITLKTPIIKQILRKYEKFSWFFDNTPITL